MNARWCVPDADSRESCFSRISRRGVVRAGLLGGVAAAAGSASTLAQSATPLAGGPPVAPKVLTVAMYQDLSRPTDPLGGEASRWIDQHHLDEQIAIPGSYSPLYCDAARDQCLVVTGMGPSNAATTMMSVGANDRIDLRQTYILIAGIGGVAPSGGTLGTAAWAEWVVDGSAANLIDPRELPSDWLYPFFHLGCGTPWCDNGFSTGTEFYQLDPAMAERAYEISKDVPLADSADAQVYRATFSDAPALAPPSVIRGDCVCSPSLPSGHILSDYMSWWMRQRSGGKGTYVMSSAEDIGTLTALRRLADAGRVDWGRIMVLRTGSDFDRGAPGQSALDAIQVSGKGGLPIAYEIALENAHRVGSAETSQILSGWDRWQDGPPA